MCSYIYGSVIGFMIPPVDRIWTVIEKVANMGDLKNVDIVDNVVDYLISFC